MFESTSDSGVVGPGTIVGANVKLTGTISDVNDITVHGTVEGEVISDKTITVAETASVKGPVTAQIISVSGKINGAVTAHQKIELLPSAQVNGSIATRELIIKSGATFNGKCSMQTDGVEVSTASATEVAEDNPVETESKIEKKNKKAEGVEEKVEMPKATLPEAPTFELED